MVQPVTNINGNSLKSEGVEASASPDIGSLDYIP